MAQIEDFQRTDQGRSDVFPALKDLPCLIANKPPTEATAQERKNGNVASPKISGEGVIVAFQKYDRYHGELYKKGLTAFDEEWIVRMDRWSTGNRSNGYFLVKYENVVQHPLEDHEISKANWRFVLREPISSEADDCAGRVPAVSKNGTSYHERPARIEDFQRTSVGSPESMPPLKDLPCLIAEEPPVMVDTVDPATGNLHLTIPLLASTKQKQ